MAETQHQWNHLSTYFDTSKNPGEISHGAADNILIAWPPIIRILKSQLGDGHGKRIADLGCGGGGFCKRLRDMGFGVTGIDPSEGMINVAKRTVPEDVQLMLGDSSALSKTGQTFDAITSIMALQFDPNIEKTVHDMHDSLTPNGIAVVAVFNPAYVTSCLKAETLFEMFDSIESPEKGTINLDGERIPTYIRTTDTYNRIFTAAGFSPLSEEKPPFTQEFLEQYPMDTPTDEPEYLILGYKRG